MMLPFEVPVYVGIKSRIVSKTESLIEGDRNLRTGSRYSGSWIRVPELAINSELVGLRIGVFLLTEEAHAGKYGKQYDRDGSAHQVAPPSSGQDLEQYRQERQRNIHGKPLRIRRASACRLPGIYLYSTIVSQCWGGYWQK